MMRQDDKIIEWMERKLPPSLYLHPDVVLIARELIGKVLVSNFNNELTAGRIVETEAYNGVYDKAAHSYNNRRTNRTEVTYATGGVAYIYFCYGIHHMLNVVTNAKDIPNVVLIRALEPLAGMDTMLLRSKKTVHGNDLTRGPGNVGKSMGIHTRQSGISLQSNELFIADDGVVYNDDDIMITPRIGVDYAAEDALLPYRFLVKGNSYVSGKKRFQ